MRIQAGEIIPLQLANGQVINASLEPGNRPDKVVFKQVNIGLPLEQVFSPQYFSYDSTCPYSVGTQKNRISPRFF